MSDQPQDNLPQDRAQVGPPPLVADSEVLRVRAGNSEVMGSGTIIHNLYAPLEFGLPASPPLTCRILFRRDYDTAAARIKHDLENDTTVVLTLINMGTRLGSGPRHPVQVATIRNRPVSIQFVLRMLNESNNIGIFDYTWFVGIDSDKDEDWAPLDTSETQMGMTPPDESEPDDTAEMDLTRQVEEDRKAAAAGRYVLRDDESDEIESSSDGGGGKRRGNVDRVEAGPDH